MKNTKAQLGIAVIIIVIIVGIYMAVRTPAIEESSYQQPYDSTTVDSSSTSNPTVTPTPVPTQSGPITYSMSEVASHNSSASCWTTINGNVYNVTSWISQHPGGAAAILSLCGKDGTSAFTAQHGGQARPESELKTFIIGKLK